MASIFPPEDKGGVPPGVNVRNGYSPVNHVVGEGPLYVSADCSTVLTDMQVNSITSELLAAVDRLGFSWNSSRLTNLGDALVAKFAEKTGEYVKITGDIMTGPLILSEDPTQPLQAATMQYAVARAGDTMTGPLYLSADPTVAMGAATKQYVDATLGSFGNAIADLEEKKENKSEKGQPNGYASLDDGGKVPAVELPSYVDDVLEYPSAANFPFPGEKGKIYVALDTGMIYRWSGSDYIVISPSPGTTDDVPEGTKNLYYTDERVLNVAVNKDGDVMTGPLNIPAGTAGNTALQFGDTGLGFYGDPTNDTVNVAVSGNNVMTWDAAGTHALAPVMLAADPTANLQAATKQYVDLQIANGASITVGDVPPPAPKTNQLWWESDTGWMWLWYDDGNSQQWVQVNGGGGGGGSSGGGGGAASSITFAPAGNISATTVQAAIVELDSEKVAKAGDTMSGALTMSGSQPVNLDGAAGTHRALYGMTAGSRRWLLSLANISAEGGSNTGSDFAIGRYADDGVALSTALVISRSNGMVTSPGGITINSNAPPQLTVNRTGSVACQIQGQSSSKARWGFTLGDITPESGSNTGSNFSIDRYDDSGAALAAIIQASRATGQITTPAPILPVTTWTATQQQSARQAIFATPFDALAYNGLQLNGNFAVSQENGAAAVAVAGGSKYVVDGWRVAISSGAVSALQVTDAPPGHQFSLKVNVTTPVPTLGASDYCLIFQVIEGWTFARLNFGTAASAALSLGFWVKANRTGTYSGVLKNGNVNREYPFTYTINASATWEYKTLTISGDTTGTWFTDERAGAQLLFTMACGTSLQGAAGTWTTTDVQGATGTINGIAASTDYLQITGVVIIPGSELPPQVRAPFIMRPYIQELAACRRYFTLRSPISGGIYSATNAQLFVDYGGPMRVVPTMNGQTAVISITNPNSGMWTQASVNAALAPTAAIDGCHVNLGNFSGLTAGLAVIGVANTGKIILDARL